ncbi:hypothetical protein [Pseudomonas svalbardensis]|uniref:hypothetical protein n=1 Tax=Pseudomonas svalbardensis TaxID=3042029 RepID=UPI0024B3B428|nr:hypothetical protein [Pseudomonas sp. PMCC200367]
MSSKPLSPSETSETAKGEAKGTIKGNITNLYTEKKYPFNATWIWRDEQQGTLRFHGTMQDPEREGRTVVVGVRLSQKDASGNYETGDERILYLSYSSRNLSDGGTIEFDATTGTVGIQNSYPQQPVNGKLDFQTSKVGRDHYHVEVVFEISQF